MNKEWHRANKMPEKATLEQRIKWHLAHAKKCGCRPVPKSIRDAEKPVLSLSKDRIKADKGG